MKNLVLLGLLAVVASASVLNYDFVGQINSAQSQWTATLDNQFAGMSVEELKQFLGTKEESYEGKVPIVSYENILEYAAVPDSFDSRKQWGQWVHPIRDQQRCGSCWAFGSTEALSDRFAIATQGKIDTVLSAQYQVSCDKANYGCEGGYLSVAWQFLQSTGVPSDVCVPYTSGQGSVQQCPKTCVDRSQIRLYRTRNVKAYRGAADAKLDILTNGPIETGFVVYQDFMAYKSGIYKHVSGQQLGGHAVKIIGWGVENGIRYWIASNSWGTRWGDNGFFRIQEGQCQFESQLIAGDPAL